MSEGVCGVQGGHWVLELDLEAIVSLLVWVLNRIRVLCSGDKRRQLLSHPVALYLIFLRQDLSFSLELTISASLVGQ